MLSRIYCCLERLPFLTTIVVRYRPFSEHFWHIAVGFILLGGSIHKDLFLELFHCCFHWLESLSQLFTIKPNLLKLRKYWHTYRVILGVRFLNTITTTTITKKIQIIPILLSLFDLFSNNLKNLRMVFLKVIFIYF